jgi:single-stranded-DNA-specific exonuclease
MTTRRWKVLTPIRGKIGNYPETISQLLCNRGVRTDKEARAFLNPDERLLYDPFLLPDMERAVARIRYALRKKEVVSVFGDFDCDGICGTAILVETLGLLGGKVIPYIPHRDEGYGINLKAVEHLRNEGSTLIVSVDCGISNAFEVEEASKNGVDVIITDHHVVPSTLPRTVAVINPKRKDSAYPFRELCGAGVALKLAYALLQNTAHSTFWKDLLDIAALGTAADLVPLVGENRYLVQAGLCSLNQTKREGLKWLIQENGLTKVDVDDVSWVLAPRINACGRMSHAMLGLRLLLSTSASEAEILAQRLEEDNAQRQRLQEKNLVRARQEVLGEGELPPIIVVGGEGYSEKVAGLVASRLVDEFYRPAVVFGQDGGRVRGSARSIPGFDITQALSRCRHLLLRFGGHPGAAGFTTWASNIDGLRDSLVAVASEGLGRTELQPVLYIDVEAPLSSLNGEVLRLLQTFPPFGRDNPKPSFLSRRVRVVGCERVGESGSHLKLKFKVGNFVWEGIGFNLGERHTEVDTFLDIVYNVELNEFRGESRLELSLIDFAAC